MNEPHPRMVSLLVSIVTCMLYSGSAHGQINTERPETSDKSTLTLMGLAFPEVETYKDVSSMEFTVLGPCLLDMDSTILAIDNRYFRYLVGSVNGPVWIDQSVAITNKRSFEPLSGTLNSAVASKRGTVRGIGSADKAKSYTCQASGPDGAN